MHTETQSEAATEMDGTSGVVQSVPRNAIELSDDLAEKISVLFGTIASARQNIYHETAVALRNSFSLGKIFEDARAYHGKAFDAWVSERCGIQHHQITSCIRVRRKYEHADPNQMELREIFSAVGVLPPAMPHQAGAEKTWEHWRYTKQFTDEHIRALTPEDRDSIKRWASDLVRRCESLTALA